jgi:hypothetical protein
MSDKHTPREITNKPADETHNTLVTDAYNFCADTISHPDARARQAFVAAYGSAVGGIKDLPNEFMKHPWETIGKVAVGGVSGVAVGAALASESTAIVTAATAFSVVASAAALWNSFTRITSNECLKNSMDAVYKCADQETLLKSMQTASNVLGPEAADYGLALAAGLTGAYGPKAFTELQWNLLVTRLKPFVPFARATENGATEITFGNNIIVHMHANEAHFQIAGEEYRIPCNANGIDMSTLGSITGRQVIKTWEITHDGKLLKPLTIDINPQLGITTMTSYRGKGIYDQKRLTELFSHRFLSCSACEPHRPKAPWNLSP